MDCGIRADSFAFHGISGIKIRMISNSLKFYQVSGIDPGPVAETFSFKSVSGKRRQMFASVLDFYTRCRIQRYIIPCRPINFQS